MIQIGFLGKNRKNIIMILVSVIVTCAVIFGTASMQVAKSKKGMSCEELAGLSFPDVTITSTEIVAGDLTVVTDTSRGTKTTFTDLPEFCRVQATLTPRENSEILMEVWLPTGWNGYYLTTGNSGWAGTVNYGDVVEGLKYGFASASTDTGHVGGAGPWVLVQDQLIDYGGRAIHETTVLAKQITRKFYGKTPEASFMKGCSLGGGQTMKAIQDYPKDFDAVVAGSPHMFMSVFNAEQVWPSWLLSKDYSKFIPEADYVWIREKVMNQCDGNIDGLKDGIVDDPQTCNFDPYSLVCPSGEYTAGVCLSTKQAEYLAQLYEGPVYQDTGELIYPGFTYGNEVYWWTFVNYPPAPYKMFFFDMHKWLYYAAKNNDPDPSEFGIADLTYTDDIRWIEDNMADIVDAYNADLRPFFKHGGKLMMYIGSEEAENYKVHLDYLGEVRKIVGPKVFEKSVRMFVVPGMHHCGGGDSCADTFDKLGAMLDWHENGEAPDVLDASKVVNGAVTFARPLCAFPYWARYKGTGDTTLASSFECLRVENPYPYTKHDNDGHHGHTGHYDNHGNNHGHHDANKR